MNVTVQVRRLVAVAATVAAVVALAACSPAAPSFAKTCAAMGGEVMEDSTTKTITGTVVSGNGGVGVGTGVVTITVRLCLSTSGEVLDMEVK